MGYPQIINHQLILVIATYGDLGVYHFKKPHFWDIIHFLGTYAQLTPFKSWQLWKTNWVCASFMSNHNYVQRIS